MLKFWYDNKAYFKLISINHICFGTIFVSVKFVTAIFNNFNELFASIALDYLNFHQKVTKHITSKFKLCFKILKIYFAVINICGQLQ